MTNLNKIYQVWVLRKGKCEYSKYLTIKQAERYINAEKSAGNPVILAKMTNDTIRHAWFNSWTIIQTHNPAAWKEYYKSKIKKK